MRFLADGGAAGELRPPAPPAGGPRPPNNDKIDFVHWTCYKENTPVKEAYDRRFLKLGAKVFLSKDDNLDRYVYTYYLSREDYLEMKSI